MDFAPEGDVILVVGAQQFRIRVDSLFLKRHSPVFRAMLGPNFREGQALSSSSPQQIKLPDDDPDAMQTLCAVMYLDFDHIPRSPTTRNVLDIVRLADKYDCYDMLTMPSQAYGWLKSDHLTKGRDLVDLLAVAYLIRDQEAFVKLSNALVLRCGESFADLADETICDALPWKIFYGLEEVRSRVRYVLDAIILARAAEGSDNSNPHSSSCSIRAENFGIRWQDLIHAKPLYYPAVAWQMPIAPLLSVFQTLARSCHVCRKRMEDAKVDTFGLRLVDDDLRRISKVPESYWGPF